MWRTIWIFSALILAVLLLLKLSRWAYMTGTADMEWITAGIAGLFLLLGMRLLPRKVPQVKQEAAIPGKTPEELGISPREFEVLTAICQGLSNKEIADHLFISESTVKTHVSQLLVKMDARRRTQLMQKAQALYRAQEGREFP